MHATWFVHSISPHERKIPTLVLDGAHIWMLKRASSPSDSSRPTWDPPVRPTSPQHSAAVFAKSNGLNDSSLDDEQPVSFSFTEESTDEKFNNVVTRLAKEVRRILRIFRLKNMQSAAAHRLVVHVDMLIRVYENVQLMSTQGITQRSNPYPPLVLCPRI